MALILGGVLMSYLDTLIRAGKSPATDFHLCMLHYPSQRNKAYQFFTSESVLSIWSKIRNTDASLLNFERRYVISSKAVYQLHRTGKKPEDSEFVADFEEWASTYHLWATCQQDYSNKFREFQLKTLRTKQTVAETKLKSDQEIVEDNNVVIENSERESAGYSGIDFLMSIAGMFDSGISNTSENAETIVTDFILKKHGKTRNGSADR